MPTKKIRIGFIPRFEVLKVIRNISEEEKLSNSKVVNILIEEALYARGLIKKIEKNQYASDFNDFFNKFSFFENITYKDGFKFDKGSDFFKELKYNKIQKRFIQFLYFKKMMSFFEEYD